jgi:hypothetical protein
MYRIVVFHALCCLCSVSCAAIALIPSLRVDKKSKCIAYVGSQSHRLHVYSQVNDVDAPTRNDNTSIDPKKEVVKIFGRLAEKYIALDSSGGNCCYSACTDCEYRTHRVVVTS